MVRKRDKIQRFYIKVCHQRFRILLTIYDRERKQKGSQEHILPNSAQLVDAYQTQTR